MVKSEGRQVIPFMPFGTSCIVSCNHLVIILADKRKESHRQYTFTGVTINATEYVKLLQIDIFDVCLFAQFSSCSLFYGFIHIEEATRQSPCSFVGLYTTLDKQDMDACTIKTEDDTIGCYGWMWIFVSVHD